MGMYSKKVMNAPEMNVADMNISKMYTVSLHPTLKGIKVVPTTIAIETGETATIKCQPVPYNADMVEVSWSVSDNSIITVNKNGMITGVKAGTAEVRAKATGEDFPMAVCKVTVKSSVVHVTGVTLNKATLSLETGASATLSATVVPANADNQNVTWSSSTNKVTVSNTGKVTAVSAGSAVITVTTADGSKKATCTVTVTEPPTPEPPEPEETE